MAIHLGETIRLNQKSVTDLGGVAITAPDSINITFFTPDGTQESTVSAGWVEVVAGEFYYDYTVPASGTGVTSGQWKAEWVIVKASKTGTERNYWKVER